MTKPVRDYSGIRMKNLSLNEWANCIHNLAKEKGWWDEPRTFGEIIALCHSELSEALEEYRNRHKTSEIYYSSDGKPEGVPIELADCIIRIFDYCGKEGIDIEEAIRIKHEYNKKRPYRHGNKAL